MFNTIYGNEPMGVAVMSQKGKGFSLVELLVCTAIISILMAMYLPALSKARRKAEQVVVTEGFRQDMIGYHADGANSVSMRQDQLPNTREPYRAAFRSQSGGGGKPVWATELLCAVETENEFRAYWHTVINPDAQAPLEFRNSMLVVRDEQDNEYLLQSWMNWAGPAVPVQWEFLSTDLGETSSGSLGATVRYSDGHVEYKTYPHEYPACRTVAELSHRYMLSLRH